MGFGKSPYTVTASAGPKRYAPYVEAYHERFLIVASNKILALDDNPPPAYEIGDRILDAFFGTGYLISSYPAIYDMCGEYMAGLDIDSVWGSLFKSAFDNRVIADASNAMLADEEGKLVAEIAMDAIGCRNNNVISSSSFIVMKTNKERASVRNASRFRTNLQFILLNNKMQEDYLNHKTKAITIYAFMMHYYYAAQGVSNKRDYDQKAKLRLWPLTTRNEFSRYLASMSGVKAGEIAEIEKRKRSWLSKNTYVFNYAVQGALFGLTYFGPYGAAVGAQVGTAIGEAQILREEGSPHWFVPFIMGPEQAWILDLL